MPRVPIPLGMATDDAPSRSVSIERLLNGYLEAAPRGKEQAPVYGTPGLDEFSDLGGTCRAMLEENGALYAVFGDSFYTVASDGTATLRGSGLPDGLVSMDTSGTTVVLEVGGEIWVYDIAAETLNPVTDPDAPIAKGMAWVANFFITYEEGTDILQSSAIDDATDYDALDFAASEARPDYGVAVLGRGKTLYAFGSRTVEAFFYDAGEGFPFSPYTDIDIDVGLAGKRAAIATSQTIFWLAHDLTVRRLDGAVAVRVSTYAVERIMKGWADASLTIASAHVWQGHLFIVFRNPEGCVVFDQSTQKWHERGSYGQSSWRCTHHAEAFGRTLFGSDDGKIYALSATTYDEAGEILPFEAIGPFVHTDGGRFSATEVELLTETGRAELGEEPNVVFDRSEDGFGWSAEKQRSLGVTGEYAKRVRFGRQGQSRGWAPRFRITDAVKRTVLGAYAELEADG